MARYPIFKWVMHTLVWMNGYACMANIMPARHTHSMLATLLAPESASPNVSNPLSDGSSSGSRTESMTWTMLFEWAPNIACAQQCFPCGQLMGHYGNAELPSPPGLIVSQKPLHMYTSFCGVCTRFHILNIVHQCT